MKEKKSFLIYLDWENLLKPMTKEQVGELFCAVFDYNKNGVVPEFEDKLLSGVFSFMQSRFDDDKEKYEKICQRNSEYAKKRWEKAKQESEPQTDCGNEHYYADENVNKIREKEELFGIEPIPVPEMYKK